MDCGLFKFIKQYLNYEAMYRHFNKNGFSANFNDRIKWNYNTENKTNAYGILYIRVLNRVEKKH